MKELTVNLNQNRYFLNVKDYKRNYCISSKGFDI